MISRKTFLQSTSFQLWRRRKARTDAAVRAPDPGPPRAPRWRGRLPAGDNNNGAPLPDSLQTGVAELDDWRPPPTLRGRRRVRRRRRAPPPPPGHSPALRPAGRARGERAAREVPKRRRPDPEAPAPRPRAVMTSRPPASRARQPSGDRGRRGRAWAEWVDTTRRGAGPGTGAAGGQDSLRPRALGPRGAATREECGGFQVRSGLFGPTIAVVRISEPRDHGPRRSLRHSRAGGHRHAVLSACPRRQLRGRGVRPWKLDSPRRLRRTLGVPGVLRPPVCFCCLSQLLGAEHSARNFASDWFRRTCLSSWEGNEVP